MMPRARAFLTYSLIALGTLAVLLLALVAFVVFSFDSEAAKRLLIQGVHQHSQRTLAIPGRIELSWWPGIGLRLGALTLSQRGSEQPFAAVRSARVAVALLPLLRGQLAIDRVHIEGLRASIRREADGRSNIDDLLGAPATGAAGAAGVPGQASSTPLALAIAGLHISDAAIDFDDRQNQRRATLSALAIEAGRIAPGEPAAVSLQARLALDKPRVEVLLALKSSLLWDPAQGRHAMSGLEAEVSGQLAGMSALRLRLAGDAQADAGARRLSSPKATLTLQAQLGGGALEGRLVTPWSLNLDTLALELPQIVAELALPGPGGARIAMAARGSVKADPRQIDARLTGQFDARYSGGMSKRVLEILYPCSHRQRGRADVRGRLGERLIVTSGEYSPPTLC